MTVRDVDNTVKIHLSEISILIVENTACSITCALLSELTLKKIKVIFCDAKRNPQSELVSYYGSHDCSQKLKNQIAWNEISKQQVWTVIVAQKIKNQASLLEFYGLEEALMLDSYVEELEFNDVTNREAMPPRSISMQCSEKALQEAMIYRLMRRLITATVLFYRALTVKSSAAVI